MSFLGACATGNSRQSAPAEPTITVPTPPAQQGTEQSSGKSSASAELRNQAIKAIESDDYAQAKRLLDRALRVDSRDPETWYEYARLSQLQKNGPQARQMINKALRLNPEPSVKQKLRELELALDSETPSLQS